MEASEKDRSESVYTSLSGLYMRAMMSEDEEGLRRGNFLPLVTLVLLACGLASVNES